MEETLRAFEAGQRRILEQAARGAPLRDLLTGITLLIEQQRPGHMTCSVLLLDREHSCVRHGAAPSLPADLVARIDGARIGPQEGSCGTAAYLGERVIVEDIATHPAWASYRAAALPHGLRACWSTPIFSASREVLGTFAMYYREPRGPDAADLELVERATDLAAVAIQRDRAEAALRKNMRMRQIVFDGVVDILFSIDVDAQGEFRFQCINQAFTRVTGLAEEQVVGRLVRDVIPQPTLDEVLEHYRTCIRERRTERWEEVSVYPAGTRHGIVAVSPVFEDDGSCTTLVGHVHDITERKRAERNMLRAQRLESLGRFAGAIAHDFNNILTAIVGNAAVGKAEAAAGGPCAPFFEEIEVASARATSLVRQILTFSRDQPPKRELVSLPGIVEEALRLVRATAPRTVSFDTESVAGAPPILAEATQIHQVLLNLFTNAVHAIGDARGRVRVRVERAVLESRLVDSTADLLPGTYARVVVEDSGAGMDEATLEHIFEPFFTTKDPGEGTGLGLAVVHGIMKSHQGGIVVRSAPGAGTTFTLYFPAAPELPPTGAKK
ncbi:MAG TPA: ATP-binding protein [Polyangia bacterium]|nr:ATP-binding protein [Polyangia bacterium]